MPQGLYDPVRRMTDPLETVHIKLPRSVIRAINSAAAKEARHASEIHRRWLDDAVYRWHRAQAKAKEEAAGGVWEDDEEDEIEDSGKVNAMMAAAQAKPAKKKGRS